MPAHLCCPSCIRACAYCPDLNILERLHFICMYQYLEIQRLERIIHLAATLLRCSHVSIPQNLAFGKDHSPRCHSSAVLAYVHSLKIQHLERINYLAANLLRFRRRCTLFQAVSKRSPSLFLHAKGSEQLHSYGWCRKRLGQVHKKPKSVPARERVETRPFLWIVQEQTWTEQTGTQSKEAQV